MKFAFLILRTDFKPENDKAFIGSGLAQIIGVSSIQEACTEAKKLMDEEISCIELCGAFGPEGAKKVITATYNQLPIGYVTHLQEQDIIFRKTFGE